MQRMKKGFMRRNIVEALREQVLPIIRFPDDKMLAETVSLAFAREYTMVNAGGASPEAVAKVVRSLVDFETKISSHPRLSKDPKTFESFMNDNRTYPGQDLKQLFQGLIEEGITPIESHEVAGMLNASGQGMASLTKEDHEEALTETCRKIAAEAQKGLSLPTDEVESNGSAYDLGAYYYARDLVFPRRIVLTMFDQTWAKILQAILTRCQNQTNQTILDLCFRCLDRCLELATSFGVPQATKGAVKALCQTILNSEGMIPSAAMIETQKMLLSGDRDHDVTAELLSSEIVDEEEDEREAELVLRQTGALLAKDQNTRQPAPPQILPQRRSKQKEEKEDDALLSPRILIRKRGNDPIRNLGKKPGRFLFKMLVGAKGGEGALLLGLVSCVNTYWKEVSYHTSVLVDMQNLGATGTAFGMIAMKRLSMSSTASPTSLLTLTLTLTLMGGGSS